MQTPSLTLIAIAYALGAISLWFCKLLPNIPHACILGILCLLIFLFLKYKKHVSFLWIIAAGFLFCLSESQSVIKSRIPKELEGVPLIIIGRIINIPENEMRNNHFEFLIEKIQSDHHVSWPMPKKIRLSWYTSQDVPQPNLTIGQKWQLQVKLKQPRSTYNPNSFDYEAWLFFHKITAVGSIINQASNVKLADAFYQNPFGQLRQYIQNNLQQALTNNNNIGLIEAIAIGVRSQVTAEQWRIMQATGTNHLVAIAGLHIGFVFIFIYKLIKFIWRRIPWLLLWCTAHEAALFGALFVVCYYSALSGFALPTQRALIMLSITLIASLLRRNVPSWQALSAALLIVLFFDPLAVFSESFYLSFVAVAVIIFAMSNKKNKSHWRQALYTQWVIALGLAPITLYFFHQISLINLIANSIAIPWIAFIALPLILLGIFVLPMSHAIAFFLWKLSAKSLFFYWPMLDFLAQLDRLQYAVMPALHHVLLAILGILLFLLPKGFPCRYLGLLTFLPLIFSPSPSPSIKLNTFQVTQLDVGQGLSTMIQTARHSLIFDTGPRLSDAYDMGQSVVVPALLAKQIHNLDALVISHGDNDHSGGAQAILRALPVTLLLTSVPKKYSDLPKQLPYHPQVNNKWVKLLQRHWLKPTIINCQSGQHWRWDGVDFMMLSPQLDHLKNSANNQSCVLKINNTFHSILLTGDIEKPTEKILLLQKNFLRSDIIVAPHHGSKTSSSKAFILAVQPEWVFYATGYHNRFHFPNQEVVERYHALHAQKIDTADDGQVSVDIPNQECCVKIHKMRVSSRHFWNFF
jgi:competence protein ComEC